MEGSGTVGFPPVSVTLPNYALLTHTLSKWTGLSIRTIFTVPRAGVIRVGYNEDLITAGASSRNQN